MRSIIVIAALALAVGVLAPRYLSNVGPAPAPAAPQTRAPASAADARPRSVVVARNAQGHFDVDGRVNGRRIDFVVDTGASVVALTARDAARLGIRPAAGSTSSNSCHRRRPERRITMSADVRYDLVHHDQEPWDPQLCMLVAIWL